MKEAFEFEDDGRTFSVIVEERRAAEIERWWWFTVSKDVHRYAPFQAAPGDTVASVQSRIVQYYNDLVFRRSQPAEPRAHWAQRGRPGRPPANKAPVPADELDADVDIEVTEE
jgi:hypothetical protein